MPHTKKVKVTLFTVNAKIEGYLPLGEGLLLSNYLNKATTHFITLTKVSVYNWEGRVQFDAPFLCVNKESIIFAKSEGDK